MKDVAHFINNNNNNLTFIMRLGNAMQTQRRRSTSAKHIGKTHDQHLEAYCRGLIVVAELKGGWEMKFINKVVSQFFLPK